MKTILVLISFLVFSVSVYAADPDNGEELHMENCTGCHDSSAYTRSNKKVKSLPKLGAQVRFCKDNLGITWFDDEVDDVIIHLNKEYYKF